MEGVRRRRLPSVIAGRLLCLRASFERTRLSELEHGYESDCMIESGACSEVRNERAGTSADAGAGGLVDSSSGFKRNAGSRLPTLWQTGAMQPCHKGE